jgi:putative membrane protein
VGAGGAVNVIGVLSAWSWEPSVLAGTGLLLAAYAVESWRTAPRERPTRLHTAAFFGALAALGLALLSPLDVLADRYLFSAHMLQHLLLVMAVPPLMLIGVPTRWLHGIRESPLAVAERALGQPLVALAAFTLCLAVWHVPELYEAALANERLHVLEHLTFLATASMFWWPVVQPRVASAQLGYLGRMVYLFVAAVPSSALGALLTLAPTPLYPTYAVATDQGDALQLRALLRGSWGLTPLADQQLGGLLMWVPGGLVYLLAIWIISLRWMGTEQTSIVAAATVTEIRGGTS